jgi:hypothetical protein
LVPARADTTESATSYTMLSFIAARVRAASESTAVLSVSSLAGSLSYERISVPAPSRNCSVIFDVGSVRSQ